MCHSKIEVSIGRSLKKAKGEEVKEEEKEEKKLFMSFRGEACIAQPLSLQCVVSIFGWNDR